MIPNDPEPSTSPNFPEGHLLQVDIAPFGEYVPRGQRLHVVEELAPTTAEDVPATHGAQLSSVVAPSISECFPAGHAVQASEVEPG